MIASQSDIRNRIDQLKLSYDGYSRQIARPGISDERRERLKISVRLLEQEIATLEKLAQFGRLESDRDKIEASAQERLEILRERMAGDPALDSYPLEERERTSGEVQALKWVLGEDTLVRQTQEWARETAFDPAHTDRTLPALLARAVREGGDPYTRANAAHDAGKLHLAVAIPALAEALDDEPMVAEIAFQALRGFSDEELRGWGVGEEVMRKVSEARNS